MSTQGKIYKGAEGVVIVLDSKGEILTGETLIISILKPGSETASEKDAELFETTKAKYVSGAADFDVAGVYKLQLVIKSTSGKWRGETVSLLVCELFA